MERARKPERLPLVMSKDETRRVLLHMTGEAKLMAQLLYGCALRLMECVRLRVKDIDFEQNQIIVHDGKEMMNRATMLPEQLRDFFTRPDRESQDDSRARTSRCKVHGAGCTVHGEGKTAGGGMLLLLDRVNRRS